MTGDVAQVCMPHLHFGGDDRSELQLLPGPTLEVIRPLEATAFQVENIRMAYVFYESGLSINVMYAVADGGKRAVGGGRTHRGYSFGRRRR